MQAKHSRELLAVIHPLKTAKSGHLLLDIVYILGADYVRFFKVRNQAAFKCNYGSAALNFDLGF